MFDISQKRQRQGELPALTLHIYVIATYTPILERIADGALYHGRVVQQHQRRKKHEDG